MVQEMANPEKPEETYDSYVKMIKVEYNTELRWNLFSVPKATYTFFSLAIVAS